MVLVSVTFDVQPDSQPAFERTWRRIFMPAIAAWPGFLDCRLLRNWPMGHDDSTAASHRMDLTFTDEKLRSQWAGSPDHEKAFAQLTALAAGFTVTRYLVAAESESTA